jgi:hypothetical protein
VSGERDFFAKMCVDAVSCLDSSTLDLKMIGMKKVIGKLLHLSVLLRLLPVALVLPSAASAWLIGCPCTLTISLMTFGQEYEFESAAVRCCCRWWAARLLPGGRSGLQEDLQLCRL